MDDIDNAIQADRQILSSMPDGHPDLAMYLSNFGIRLGNKYLREGGLHSLEEAIQVTRKAISITPMNHSNWPSYMNNLGIRLNDKYLRLGHVNDLEEAIDILREAISRIADNLLTRPALLNNLGNCLHSRYARTGHISDIEQAIQVIRQAIKITPEENPNWATYMNNLGNFLEDKNRSTGEASEFEEAIYVSRKAVDATPIDNISRAARLNNLSVRLYSRFLGTGAISNLEEGIQLARQAVSTTPENHPSLSVRLHNLGIQLGARYTRIGAMFDLEESIHIAKQAVDATPKDHPDYARNLNSLANHLGDKYSRTQAEADLDNAILVAQQAVDAAPKDHPFRAGYLNNLGLQLGDKYAITKEEAYLNGAISNAMEAVDATPKDHFDRAGHLNTLAIRLADKYLQTQAVADLEEAIQVAEQTVKATPKEHPGLAGWLNNLGRRLFDRYSKTGAMDDLGNAVTHHHVALLQSNSPTITRIQAGASILQCCALVPTWQKAYEAMSIAIPLIPRLATRSLDNYDKQHILGKVVGLASSAAAVALQLNKRPIVALNFLEEGRGVLAASLEEMRIDVLDLRERHPQLADDFVRLRDELEVSITRRAPTLDANPKLAWKTLTNRRYEASNELDELLVEIRKQPGFEDFLLVPAEEEIQAAASKGPIVLINVSEIRCDAILVEHHQIRCLALPFLKSEDIDKQAKINNLGSPSALEWLWNAAANPILDALGFTQSPTTDDWPHVWWILTGILSKFPIHAAGYHKNGLAESVLDRVMSSYSSSIKAIIHGRRRRSAPSAIPAKALLVAMQNTPEQSQLHFANKEVDMLRDLCGMMALDPVEPGRRKKDIVSHLPNCKIFHFAGHGHTNNNDPSQSHLLLEDWQSDKLTVATLLDINIRTRSPFLAYLSACGTGQVKDEKFFDESLHLISACNLAGFRHVIGTLWEVNDESCVVMSRITYEEIRDGALSDASVCHGLHKATRELRNRWLGGSENTDLGSKRVGKPNTGLAVDATGAEGADDRRQKDSRDVYLVEDDDEASRPLPWVPYVHFGV
ncbi:30S ribosomal protein S17P-like protein [Colletotrichum tofieldiae]|uniref:30S ribosomal protein S17P-like protein n=1 Tax=Colletotrichum tofieldiae TaxID=708197 RepID=A0A166PUC7_9PEZI|nr:30S ribosomal protein S17P-like protein [Colletotrichum tofieldiae]